jgi:gliding motility-associated-like protein
LDAGAGQQGYYGVFLADLNISKTFDINFGSNGCKNFRRTDNSESLWNTSTVESGIANRIELIAIPDLGVFVTDLGTDKSFCDQNSYALKTTLTDIQGKSFLWSTGETTPSIVVTRSGTYAVRVSQGCFFDQDSVTILLQKKPPVFSLGQDEMVCDFMPRVLKPMAEKGDYKFIWQDGSGNISFEAKNHGIYWLRIENTFGVSVDSIEYVKSPEEKLRIPNIITPNGDTFNQFFEILPVIPATHLFVYNRWGKRLYHAENYQNNWDGNDLAPGIYFYTLALGCLGDRKGVITLQR